MSLEFVFEWGLRSLIWNPAAEVSKHLAPAKSEQDSIANALAVFRENPGLLFAVAAIGAKYFAFNPSASQEYNAYLQDRSSSHFAALWKANPGLIGGALMSLEFVLELGLRTLIWNPAAEVGKHLAPATSEEDSIANTLAVFKENPGLLFAVAAIGAKYFAFNLSASVEYGAYLQDRSPSHFTALWKANPGLIGGALMSLEFVFEWSLRSLIWNPAAEVGKHLAPAKSEEASIANTLTVFKENPGLLLFAVVAIGAKYFAFNPSASQEYNAYLQDRSPAHFAALWIANPGLIGGALMSLEFVLEWGLRSLIWNPAAEVSKHLAPAKSEEDSIANTLAVFRENPGLLFAVAAIGAKYFAFNPSASQEYNAYLQDRYPSHLTALWKANPGLIGGALMSLEFVFEWGLRSLIWNPAAEVGKHLAPARSEDDSIVNAFAVFSENPGLLFAVVAISAKYLGFNPSASAEYGDYIQDRAPSHFAALWKANPGLIGGGLLSLEFVLEWGLRSTIWNPHFEAKKFMFDKEAKIADISLIDAGTFLDRWPGLMYGVLLLSIKYGVVNFSVREEYIKTFKTIGGAAETFTLFQSSPGLTTFTVFIVLKFLRELEAKVLIDDRLLENYTKFWENPSLESARSLLEGGLIGAALTGIGRGLYTVLNRKNLAKALQPRPYQA